MHRNSALAPEDVSPWTPTTQRSRKERPYDHRQGARTHPRSGEALRQ